jgi:hypothetical protein
MPETLIALLTHKSIWQKQLDSGTMRTPVLDRIEKKKACREDPW